VGVEPAEPAPDVPDTAAPIGFWARVHEHKIMQWGVGYFGAALALAHGAELVGHAFEWPEIVNRVFMIALIVGFPIALTLAWYHGHRGLKGISPAELAIISVLVLIGAVFFTVSLHPTERSVPHAATGLASEPVAPAAASEPSSAPAARATTPEVQRGVLPNSVAVLPFDNLSPDGNDAYFAAGIHEEVLSQLGKLSNLNVISRTSVARYANTDLSIRQIGTQLHVRAVMEGSVRYANNQVRITAQLVDADTDQRLWSDVYQRDLADVFAVQADIAMNIANALQAEFSPAEQRTLERKPTSSPAAYALYLQARSLVDGDLDIAQTLLDRAISIDPQFGRAYGLKALLYGARFVNTTAGNAVAPEGRADLETRIREFARRAMEIDPTDPDARAGLRGLNLPTWRWRAFERDLQPGDEARLQAAQLWALSWMGKPAEAVKAGEKTADLNPNDSASQMALGVVYAYAGNRSASIRSLEKALELAPTNPLSQIWLAYNAIAAGNTAAALANLQAVEQLLGDSRPTVFLPELAYAYSRIGRGDDARRLFGEIQALGKTADIGAGTWALGYVAIGDDKEALRWLEVVADKARKHEPDQGYINVMNLKMNFLGDRHIEEPAFAAVLSRIRGDYE
jgi:TolB-like protein/Flp pilus assembly protein TadD